MCVALPQASFLPRRRLSRPHIAAPPPPSCPSTFWLRPPLTRAPPAAVVRAGSGPPAAAAGGRRRLQRRRQVSRAGPRGVGGGVAVLDRHGGTGPSQARGPSPAQGLLKPAQPCPVGGGAELLPAAPGGARRRLLGPRRHVGPDGPRRCRSAAVQSESSGDTHKGAAEAEVSKRRRPTARIRARARRRCRDSRCECRCARRTGGRQGSKRGPGEPCA